MVHVEILLLQLVLHDGNVCHDYESDTLLSLSILP